MNCKQCGKVISDKARYCGDKCRMKWNRTPIFERVSKANEPEHVRIEPEQKGNPNISPVTAEEWAEVVKDVESTLHPRTNPDALNYGASMNSDQLKQAGLTANRVPIPGDWDYEGACVKVDGVWTTKRLAGIA